MKNVDLIAQTLEAAGVKWVFGVPSGPVLPLIDALERTSVRYVLTASETSAGFMASAVGSLTGTPGVCLSTLGPGATNMSTGVGCAWLDCAPLVAITCNVPTPWLERRIQMRIDHHALFAPITKASLPLRHTDVAARVTEALAIATAEPPGPVHLDLPEDVGAAEAPADAAAVPNGATVETAAADASAAVAAGNAVAAVADALAASRRPVVMTGLGFTRTRAADALQAFVERQGIPFISTMHGKGWLPESHPNWAGVLGRARRTNVQRFINGADLVIAVGYDPIEINYEEWAGSIPVVHVANQAADVDGSVDVRFNEATYMDEALRGIAGLAPAANDWSVEEWAVHRAQLDADLRPETATMSAHRVLDNLREKLPADGILVYDVGAHTHQIATQWRTDLPNTCVSTNGWSSMGYGIPGAIAAKLAHPDRRVVGVVGDGCFQMTAGELAVMRRLDLPLPIVVLNDGWLALIKLKQQGKSYGVGGSFLGEPPPTPPEYFGVPTRTVHDEAGLGEALDWGMSLDGPSVIEAYIDPDSYARTVYD
ncbi:MAG: thiamine pyrophosphate-binding protein [Chloroflexi bacterium]|nr:thiamine pyrophosphate-binding protein [Chloroflexota bacterium]